MKWDQHCWDRKLKSLNWTKKNQATPILRNQWKFIPYGCLVGTAGSNNEEAVENSPSKKRLLSMKNC
jgi:hypothetical protein